jgi:hypothetical protein
MATVECTWRNASSYRSNVTDDVSFLMSQEQASGQYTEGGAVRSWRTLPHPHDERGRRSHETQAVVKREGFQMSVISECNQKIRYLYTGAIQLTSLAVPWLRRLHIGFSPPRPGYNLGDFLWDSCWTKWHWSGFFYEFLRFSPANHHSTIASWSIITPPSYAVALITQHIIISSISKLGLFLTRHLAGYGVRIFCLICVSTTDLLG